MITPSKSAAEIEALAASLSDDDIFALIAARSPVVNGYRIHAIGYSLQRLKQKVNEPFDWGRIHIHAGEELGVGNTMEKAVAELTARLPASPAQCAAKMREHAEKLMREAAALEAA